MNLSRFLVSESGKYNFTDVALPEIKKQIRDLTFKWMDENLKEVEFIKNNFQQITGKDFSECKEKIFYGIADHYSEKIFGYTYDVDKYIKFINNIDADSKDIKLLKYTISEKDKVCLLFGGHFSGNEFFPFFMGLKDFPFSIFLRFQSENTRKLVYDRLPQFKMDVRLGFVDDGLLQEVINIKKNKRIVYTVVDSFESWKITSDSQQMELFGRETKLDVSVDKMIKLLDADVYWATFERDGLEKYRFILKKISPDSSGIYIKSLMNQWQNHLLAKPRLYYAWNEIHEMWEATDRKD